MFGYQAVKLHRQASEISRKIDAQYTKYIELSDQVMLRLEVGQRFKTLKEIRRYDAHTRILVGRLNNVYNQLSYMYDEHSQICKKLGVVID